MASIFWWHLFSPWEFLFSIKKMTLLQWFNFSVEKMCWSWECIFPIESFRITFLPKKKILRPWGLFFRKNSQLLDYNKFLNPSGLQIPKVCFVLLKRVQSLWTTFIFSSIFSKKEKKRKEKKKNSTTMKSSLSHIKKTFFFYRKT